MNEAIIAEDFQVNELDIRKSWLILRAVDHKLRCKMLQLIHQCGELTVTELYLKLGLEQSLVSQHLAILRQAGFVHTKRNGKFICYSVNYSRLDDVQFIAANLVS